MSCKELPFSSILSHVVDNRGRSCPTSEKGIPLIATNCIKNDALYPVFEKIRFVSEETYRSWFRGHPCPGDMIFVTKGSPGRVCLAPDPIEFCIAQDMVAIRANQELVSPKYLFAILRSPVVQKRIQQLQVGTMIPHFKKGDFDKLLLPIPARGVQDFVGNLYFDLSFMIECNRRMNETLEKMAQAIFKSWFVDFDPVRWNMDAKNGKAVGKPPVPPEILKLFPDSFQESELGLIPKGWEVGPLSRIANLATETVNPGKFQDKMWKHYSIPAFDQNRQPVNEKGECIKSVKFQVPSHSILVSKLNPQFPRVWLTNVSDQAVSVCSTEFIPLVSNDTSELPFLHGLLTSDYAQTEMKNRATGSTGSRQRVKPNEIAAMPVLIPSRLIRQYFSYSTASNLDATISNIESMACLASLRDTLLPKLISGELRIKDAEKFIEDNLP